jgi:AsmA protein
MKNLLKWSAIIVGCLVVVIIAAMLLIPMFVDVNKYKPVLESKVAEATGRPFSIGDDLSLSLFPWAGVSLSDLRLGNPAGFSEKDFVTVKSFEVRIKLLPLLRKDIQVKRFVLNEPRVELVKNKNGRVNWEQPKGSSKEAAERKEEKAPAGGTSGINLPISALTVGNLAINNGSALWIDHTSDTRKEISDINLALKDVSMERPVQLTFSAQMDKKPFALEGTIGPLGKGFQAETVPVDLSLKALKQLALRLVGSVVNPITNPGVDMDIEIAEFSPRKLVAELGQEFPVKTSDPNALNSVSLKAHVKADAKKAALSKGVMNLDQSKLDFSATAADFSRPNLKFDLALDQIDLDRYMAPKSEQPAQAAGTSPPAKEKADYTPLRRMILEGTAKIGKLTVSKAKIQDVLVEINAKNGIINLDPLKLKMYQGNADGKATLNVVKDIPQSSMKLRVNSIQVQPLLKDVMDKDFLAGSTNADINLSMEGDQPDRIKKTLNGKGERRFNDGAIVGIDLAGMVRNIGSAFGLAQKSAERPKTDFTELVMPFTIKNGVANTPGTSMKSPFIRINAAGTADLVKETLDFRVEPKAVGSIKGQGDETQRSGIMVPVLVSGTFADPKFRPDLSSAAKEKIEEKIMESKEVKKVLEKDELKSLGKPAKDVLKGILGD